MVFILGIPFPHHFLTIFSLSCIIYFSFAFYFSSLLTRLFIVQDSQHSHYHRKPDQGHCFVISYLSPTSPQYGHFPKSFFTNVIAHFFFSSLHMIDLFIYLSSCDWVFMQRRIQVQDRSLYLILFCFFSFVPQKAPPPCLLFLFASFISEPSLSRKPAFFKN